MGPLIWVSKCIETWTFVFISFRVFPGSDCPWEGIKRGVIKWGVKNECKFTKSAHFGPNNAESKKKRSKTD